jgi:hypothetical protein
MQDPCVPDRMHMWLDSGAVEDDVGRRDEMETLNVCSCTTYLPLLPALIDIASIISLNHNFVSTFNKCLYQTCVWQLPSPS